MTLRRALLSAAILAPMLASCATAPGDGFDDQGAAIRAYADLTDTGFTGDFAVSQPGQPDTIYYGATDPDEASVRTLEGWPWASVTKQVIAVLVMREVEEGRLALDSDVGALIPALRGRGLTVEDLLRHRSNLPNPDETPRDDSGFPSFYTSKSDPLDFCTEGQDDTEQEAGWQYNNCDYIVLGAVLEASANSSLDLLLAQGIGLDAGWYNTSFMEADSERPFASRDQTAADRIAGYGASGALVGPLDDMLLFDRALMDGVLLSDDALAQLWNGNPTTGSMALGQWVFEAPLAGCNNPVRIVERRGAIGDYQLRNVMMPDLGIAVALATDQPEFDFAEIWTGNGPMHDLLATLACG
ncbi:serine hydrolase domain-containing protein [Aurantiacibacter rhizosphaerae]|uniref:Serine hydrolase n=1 Tax=Aurantiacibacter rhizosphaerae TaxID=2691582 RepID=A0A844XFD0_9SPHN|nr:serine hydrolase [Aurantiacibacter rhizosphaerae]MWV28540.1 serine hydrolase [Aurantiacibacter rhizosphaerae]